MTSQPSNSERPGQLRAATIAWQLFKAFVKLGPMGAVLSPRPMLGPAGLGPVLFALGFSAFLIYRGAPAAVVSMVAAGCMFAAIEIVHDRRLKGERTRKQRLRAARHAEHRAAWDAALNAPIDEPDDR